MARRVFAVAAHPDDIEFTMAGTLILLAQVGYEIHYLTITNGSVGSKVHGREEIIRIRREESRASAALLGAIYHESLVDDIEIFYEKALLLRVAAIMRTVAPEILLTQSPSDYMEDHQNAARLAVTAAFCRSMPNYITDPPVPPVDHDVTVYHGQPHSNLDPFRHPVWPDLYVDITDVFQDKLQVLACHRSQQGWLDETQGMTSVLQTMQAHARELGRMSGQFEYAEGWRRRLHLGFCPEHADPLADALSACVLRATGQ
ncbi:MAG: PIG-L family deacetylase [Anaerolineae bacterium]|nr:PIG-L family deacetylase [Anaerolineae bacterium]